MLRRLTGPIWHFRSPPSEYFYDSARPVLHLKVVKDVVAAMDVGTHNAFAQGAADASLSVGLSGAEIIEEASTMSSPNDHYEASVKYGSWERAVNHATKCPYR